MPANSFNGHTDYGIGIGLRVLHSETSYYPGIDWATSDELFAWTFLGLPALGALLQVLRWLGRRNRTV